MSESHTFFQLLCSLLPTSHSIEFKENKPDSVKTLELFTDFDNMLKYLLPLNSLSGQQPLQSNKK